MSKNRLNKARESSLSNCLAQRKIQHHAKLAQNIASAIFITGFFFSEKLKRTLLRHIFFPLLSTARVAENFLSCLYLPTLGIDVPWQGAEQICGVVKQGSSAAKLLPQSVSQS